AREAERLTERGHPCPQSVRSTLGFLFALRAHADKDVRAPISMNLKNKIAIVTGGTKGIGLGVAEALLREGLSVCISARHQDEIDQTVDELNQISGGRAIGFGCDVRDHKQVK